MRKLKEKLVNINDEDIDPIVEQIISFIRDVDSNNDIVTDFMARYIGDTYPIAEFTGSMFKSEDLVRANIIKPCTIKVVLRNHGNQFFYNPKNSTISIILSGVFISYLLSRIDSLRRFPQYAPQNFKSWFKNNIKPAERTWSLLHSVNGYYTSIYHELSHWYRDATGNGFLDKIIDGGNSKETPQEFNSRLQRTTGYNNPTVFSDFEVDAQAHAVFALKKLIMNKNPQRWDDLTFSQLFDFFSPNWGFYIRNYYKVDPEETKNWIVRLWKRCHREKNLLGNKMLSLNVEDVIEHANRFEPLFESYTGEENTTKYKWWDETTWGIN